MEKRLAKVEQTFEDIRRDIESGIERKQQETRDYISQSQETLFARIAAMMAEMGLENIKGLLMDPNALIEDPSPPFKANLSIETPAAKQPNTQAESSQRGGMETHDDPNNYTVLDFDKLQAELSQELEDRYKQLEERFKAMESINQSPKIDARELSLVPDLVLPPKFKMPEFEKYNGTTCPEAHLTMFIRRMTGHINNDPLLIHCFQDSLIGSAARWYNQLSRNKIHSWKDLARAFMKQYRHIITISPDRLMLQNMEKRPNESFRQYVQRWREVAIQVQPPLLEKEAVMLFVGTLKKPFLGRIIGGATKDFSNILMNGEMIENAIRNGQIEDEEEHERM